MNQTKTSGLKSSAMVYNIVTEDEIKIFSKNKTFGVKIPLTEG